MRHDDPLMIIICKDPSGRLKTYFNSVMLLTKDTAENKDGDLMAMKCSRVKVTSPKSGVRRGWR